MTENTHIVYLSLGTNLGNRSANLRGALAGLLPHTRVLRASPVYETEPWGYTDQPAFYNQVVEAETRLEPAQLLEQLKRLESDLGREPTFRYGPRLIDMDVLFYDSQIVEHDSLQDSAPAHGGACLCAGSAGRFGP
jgi:2-amino-4-hydroxy-6-hydroxymethyldihydropteridine diphosphokinase